MLHIDFRSSQTLSENPDAAIADKQQSSLFVGAMAPVVNGLRHSLSCKEHDMSYVDMLTLRVQIHGSVADSSM